MNETKPKAFVFVLMPFAKDFDDTYMVGIKPACKDAGAYCERVDEQIFVEDILRRVYDQIAKADILIAEMTGRNPNVFYETGYAHALNKRVILLTKEANDIPFDLKHYPHIIYGQSLAKLKQELENRVRWCIENPKESPSSVDPNLQFFINGVELKDNPQIDVSLIPARRLHDYYYTGEEASLTIEIHNPTSKVMDSKSFALALLAPSQISFSNKKLVRSVTHLPDERNLFNIGLEHILFPGGRVTLRISIELVRDVATDLIDGNAIRLFTELGPKDYPFTLKLRRNSTIEA